ncbi:MAG: hypothetical protein IKA74_07435 [Clostridia bacterium]|nr:hypothetical protein [Clostridia bacterium]
MLVINKLGIVFATSLEIRAKEIIKEERNRAETALSFTESVRLFFFLFLIDREIPIPDGLLFVKRENKRTDRSWDTYSIIPIL